MEWNSLDTGKYEGMLAETVAFAGHGGKQTYAYYAKPLGVTNYPSIVLIPHMPGWDEFYRETARRFAAHGYAVLCPDLYRDFGTGNPAEIASKANAEGGVYDADVMADCKGALDFLKIQPNANGKVGVIGTCSGGRHAFLAACTVDGFAAAVDCWGGVAGGDPTPQKPVAPIDYAEKLSIPLLGIFGNDDHWPAKEDVDAFEARLKELGKDYEFHRYDGAGHGIWYYQNQMYRQEAAMDSWEKVFAFFGKHLK